MAKKIPVKKKQSQFTDRKVNQMLADYDMQTDEQYEIAKSIMRGQPDECRELVLGMVDVMQEMAGRPTATIQIGRQTQRVNIPDMIQERNFYYYAVRMLIACARMDIQIAGFDPKVCVVCGGKA